MGLPNPSWKWANTVSRTTTHSQCFSQLRLKTGGKLSHFVEAVEMWNLVFLDIQRILFFMVLSARRACVVRVSAALVWACPYGRRKTQGVPSLFIWGETASPIPNPTVEDSMAVTQLVTRDDPYSVLCQHAFPGIIWLGHYSETDIQAYCPFQK